MNNGLTLIVIVQSMIKICIRVMSCDCIYATHQQIKIHKKIPSVALLSNFWHNDDQLSLMRKYIKSGVKIYV